MKGGPLVGSKFLDKRWKKLDHDEHLRRIQEIKSEVSQKQLQPYRPDPKMRLQKKEAML